MRTVSLRWRPSAGHSPLGDAEKAEAWDEIASALAAFEGPDGFVGPCELVVAAGAK